MILVSNFHLLIRLGWQVRLYSHRDRAARPPNGLDHHHRRVDYDGAAG
jgi:hypothetical protein